MARRCSQSAVPSTGRVWCHHLLSHNLLATPIIIIIIIIIIIGGGGLDGFGLRLLLVSRLQLQVKGFHRLCVLSPQR